MILATGTSINGDCEYCTRLFVLESTKEKKKVSAQVETGKQANLRNNIPKQWNYNIFNQSTSTRN
jgi:hypothetical protein